MYIYIKIINHKLEKNQDE